MPVVGFNLSDEQVAFLDAQSRRQQDVGRSAIVRQLVAQAIRADADADETHKAPALRMAASRRRSKEGAGT